MGSKVLQTEDDFNKVIFFEDEKNPRRGFCSYVRSKRCRDISVPYIKNSYKYLFINCPRVGTTS